MMYLSPSGLLTVRSRGRDIPIARIDTESRLAALRGLGHSEAIAAAILDGALGSRMATVGLGRHVGLIIPVDTSEARSRGLVK